MTNADVRISADQEEIWTSSNDDEYLYSTGTNKSKIPTVVVKINKSTSKGSLTQVPPIDIVDETAFKHIKVSRQHRHWQPLSLQAFTCLCFQRQVWQANVQRTITRYISFQNQRMSSLTVLMYFLKGSTDHSLVTKLLLLLEFFTYTWITWQPRVYHSKTLPSKYSSLFQGIGKLKGVEVKLHHWWNDAPVAQQPRRIPFH